MSKQHRQKRKNRESTSATRQRIVDATFAIAAEKGFEQATTAEIARQAGVSEGSIYNYFRTKDDLLIHMVGEYAGSFLEELSGEVAAQKEPAQKLERLIEFHVRFFTRKGNIFQVVFGKTPGTRVQWARIIQVVVGPYAGLIDGIIREGIKRRVFKPVNPQVAASLLLGGMQLTILRHFFGLGEYDPDEAIGEIKRIYLGGMVAGYGKNT
jgi:TetR/AcrR family fatty acid metabolism transcriptional regulator